MAQHSDNWRQIQLRNVLLSMALFGVALALARSAVQLKGSPLDFYAFMSGIGALSVSGGAIGGIFGRYRYGMIVGFIVSVSLAAGAVFPPSVFAAYAAGCYICFRRMVGGT